MTEPQAKRAASEASGDGWDGSAGPGPAVLRAVDLRRRFNRVQALDGLSLEVFPGEIYGLIGPDGAGKTTALRILAGVMGPDAGRAWICGMDPLSAKPEVRNALGYMPQQYSLYGDLSVDENLRFFSRMFCLTRQEYAERRARLLSITRLERFGDRRADALSGGMYKKLALACSLLPRPRVLILDEPTNGVDPVSRRELWTLLFELSAEGIGILISTAYMDEAARCHRVGLIHRGKLLLEGKPSELIAKFDHPTFAVVGGDQSQLERALGDHPDVLAQTIYHARFRIVVRRGQEQAVRQIVEAAGAELASAKPDFEDLFLASQEAA
jgi:ABC-2 type transport system ATP-binding protein